MVVVVVVVVGGGGGSGDLEAESGSRVGRSRLTECDFDENEPDLDDERFRLLCERRCSRSFAAVSTAAVRELCFSFNSRPPPRVLAAVVVLVLDGELGAAGGGGWVNDIQ